MNSLKDGQVSSFMGVTVRANPLIPPGYALLTDREGNIVGVIKPKKDDPA